MNRRITAFWPLVLTGLVLAVAGCEPTANEGGNSAAGSGGEVAGEKSISTMITPGPDAQATTQEALILAEPGDVIEFAEGRFDFDGTLTVDGAKDLTIRGAGMEKTVLNFAKVKAGKGGEGFRVKADNFTLEDLTLEDTPGDSIKLQDCNGLTIRRVKTWWTGGAATENGAYGLYPVLSTNVLIEECVAEGASDAGIYVGQSRQVIVRKCVAKENVAGIEIENCIGADVYDNVASNNTGGILVFSLPGLTIKNGSKCRVFDNKVSANNHPNFAKEGAMVSTVPPGTGVMIMANNEVEIFQNEIKDNKSAGCLIVSFLIAQRKFDDASYDPYLDGISIHDNTFSGGGEDPQGEFLAMYKKATGQRLPDIVIDGVVDPEKTKDQLLGYSFKNNGEATFVNLDLGKMFVGQEPKMTQDLAPYSADLPKIDAVVIPNAK